MDKLWQAYNAELAALRQLGAEFAEQHPQVAAHLSLRDEQVEDPHVSRLLEGVALQTARIRVNLDHDFPELTQALIGTLYPDYHAPVPSQSIVQFSLIEQAPAPVCIEAGSQLTTPQADKPCLFRVNDTISVLPARLSDVRWQAAPVAAPKLPKPYEAVLQAKLTPSANAQWSTITDDSLRFYISASEPASFSLYQALLNQTVGVAIAGEVNGEEAVVYLPPEALQPYGLDQASPGLDGRSSAAHHQLSDFFLFPKRFLFVELQQLISTETGFNCWAKFQHGFTLYFYCRHTDSTLSTQVNNKSLALGCASVINLFEAPVVPIPAKDVGIEALLQVDPAHSHHADIYRLKTLTAHNSRGQAQHLQPFYKTRQTQKNTTLYWTSRREPANQSYRVNTREAQVNTFVSLVDDQFEITGQKSDWIIEGRAWCTNRQWPNELPFGPKDPMMALTPAKTNVRVSCLEKPTPSRLPPQGQASRWQLVHGLSLQSFAGESGLQVLKDTLMLYSMGNVSATEGHIEALKHIELQPATTLLHQGEHTALCRGTHIHITLSQSYSRHHQCYLLGCLLHRFFASLCSINTFTQLSFYSPQETEPLLQWSPQTGTQPIL